MTIYADLYRAARAKGDRLPTITVCSPYGKNQGHMIIDDYPYRAGVSRRLLSGLDKFEDPDPAWWCAQGYAVVNPDPRGACSSEGDMSVWDRQEGEDGHDLVEWIAAQTWGDGPLTRWRPTLRRTSPAW